MSKTFVISYQKAAAICRREGLPFPTYHDRGERLLATGAKLARCRDGFTITGYAADRRDLAPYI